MSQSYLPEQAAHLAETRRVWDAAASTFDEAPDHGLRDAATAAAWTAVLRAALPTSTAKVLDLGCGTGSLSLIAAELGHQVTGTDISPAMLALAREKTARAGFTIDFRVMDAAFPHFLPASFDVVLCRHVLWSLPEPAAVLQRWTTLLKPDGRLVLIEGFWHTGAGLHAEDILKLLPAALTDAIVQNLGDQPVLWGGSVTDERYLIVGHLRGQD